MTGEDTTNRHAPRTDSLIRATLAHDGPALRELLLRTSLDLDTYERGLERQERPRHQLADLDPVTRAVTVLLTYGAEDPTLVGLLLPVWRHLPDRRRNPHLRALNCLDRARQLLAPNPLPERAAFALHLRAAVRDHLRRWCLLLRASGAYSSYEELSEIPMLPRQNVQRKVKIATREFARYCAKFARS